MKYTQGQNYINVTTCSVIVSLYLFFLIYCLHHVAIMSVLFSVPIWSLGPTGPPLSAATYRSPGLGRVAQWRYRHGRMAVLYWYGNSEDGKEKKAMTALKEV